MEATGIFLAAPRAHCSSHQSCNKPVCGCIAQQGVHAVEQLIPTAFEAERSTGEKS